MRRASTLFLASSVAGLLSGSLVYADGLSDLLRGRQFAHLGIAPIGPALASTVASTYPVASASASVIYEYNPALETLERRPGVGAPVLGERAESIGRRQLDVGISYSYVRLATIDG